MDAGKTDNLNPFIRVVIASTLRRELDLMETPMRCIACALGLGQPALNIASISINFSSRRSRWIMKNPG